MITDYLALSVTDCKRLGYFAHNRKIAGSLIWSNNGQKVGEIYFSTDTTKAQPVALLSYIYNGTPQEFIIPLRWKPSNLNNGGYYLFSCPVTGRSCRKLYLVGGRFVSRYAFQRPPLYESQTRGRREKAGGDFRYLRDVMTLEELTTAPNRKHTYRGKLTPYGRKCEKLAERIESTTPRIERKYSNVTAPFVDARQETPR